MIHCILVVFIILHAACSVDIISTIAGTGSGGYGGDNGAATSAGLNCPLGVAVDSSGIIRSKS